MVNEISPAYYAQGDVSIRRFDVSGSGLSLIPGDALAVLSDDNDDPLKNKETQDDSLYEIIVEQSPTEMSFSMRVVHGTNVNVYLGAIVSADRNTVYWVNNTRPLP